MNKQSYQTITKSAHGYTYQHKTDSQPTPVTIKGLYGAAQDVFELGERLEAGLDFLRDVILEKADTGKGFDEYQLRGLSAILAAMSEGVTTAHNERRAELRVIEALVDEEVA